MSRKRQRDPQPPRAGVSRRTFLTSTGMGAIGAATLGRAAREAIPRTA